MPSTITLSKQNDIPIKLTLPKDSKKSWKKSMSLYTLYNDSRRILYIMDINTPLKMVLKVDED